MKRKIFAPIVTRPKDPTTRLLQSFVMGFIKAKEIDESPIGPAEEEFVKNFIKELFEFRKELQIDEDQDKNQTCEKSHD